jgi:hypothetical protein
MSFALTGSLLVSANGREIESGPVVKSHKVPCQLVIRPADSQLAHFHSTAAVALPLR